MQTYCWLGEVMNGATGGVTGQYKRMEALKIKIQNPKYSGGVQYRAHLSDYRMAGFGKAMEKWPGQPGQYRRMEAVQIKLTGKMAEKYDMPILYSCHPRSRKRLEQSGFELDKRVIQHEPLGFHDYNCLQMNAFCVVSDSGTLPEESSFFTSVGHPFPAVCIRTSTERPEALDKACFVLAGIDDRSLLQAVDTAVQMNLDEDYGIPVPDYVEENVSSKVVKIIQSYTGVVDKMVWRKF